MTRGTKDSLLLAMQESGERERLAGILSKAGHLARCVGNVDEAMTSYRDEPAACVVTDQKLPGGGGEHLTAMLRDVDGDAIVIVLSEHAGVEETASILFETGAEKPGRVRGHRGLGDTRHGTGLGRCRRLDRREDFVAGFAHEWISPRSLPRRARSCSRKLRAGIGGSARLRPHGPPSESSSRAGSRREIARAKRVARR